MTGLSSIPEGYVGAHDWEPGTWTDRWDRTYTDRCRTCGVMARVAGPRSNPFVVLSESGLKDDCETRMVRQVMES